jgi:regulator of sigma E protease
MEFLLSKLSLVGPFFLLLGILIFIHEWGHFIVARMCGVRVETFSLGFGPKILKWKWGETDYCLSLIPLGGYVKMFGDGTEEDPLPESEHSHSFNHQSVWERIAIVSAGPLMNLIFAFILFLAMGFFGAPEVSTQIGDIAKNTSAYSSGLRAGDTILKVNGAPVDYFQDFTNKISAMQNGSNARLEVQSSDGTAKSVLVPILIKENKSPLATSKYVGVVEGLNLIQASSKVGIDFRSPLLQQGALSVEVISRVNGLKTKTLQDLKAALLKADPSKNLILSVQKNKGESIDFTVKKSDQSQWTFENAGLVKPELMVGQVRGGSPAEKAGLSDGDQILSINGKELKEWPLLVDEIKTTSKGESATLVIGNKDGKKTLTVTPNQTEILTATGQVEYRPTIGLAPALEYLPPATKLKKISGIGALLSYGAERSSYWTKVTLSGFKKLLTGEVSHKTLSGVISIGKVARDSLDIGWSYFIKMMAIISINLFLLNLFPIPVLDGGHLLFYFAEVVKGSPVSLKTKIIGQQIGVVLVMSLVVYTIFNDFSRIIFSGW